MYKRKRYKHTHSVRDATNNERRGVIALHVVDWCRTSSICCPYTVFSVITQNHVVIDWRCAGHELDGPDLITYGERKKKHQGQPIARTDTTYSLQFI